MTGLQTIEEATLQAERSPNQWPQILAEIRGKTFIAKALVSNALAVFTLAYEASERQEEVNHWFLEGAILFEALLAFEVFTSTYRGLEELFSIGAGSRGDGHAAAVSPGAAFNVATLLVKGPRPASKYVVIAESFVNSLLLACQVEIDRQHKMRSSGRLQSWLRNRFHSVGPFEEHRLVRDLNDLIALRILALMYLSEVQKAAYPKSQPSDALAKAITEEIDLFSQDEAGNRKRAIFFAAIGVESFNKHQYREALFELNKAIEGLSKYGDAEDDIVRGRALVTRGRVLHRLEDPWQALRDLTSGLEVLDAHRPNENRMIFEGITARGVLHGKMNRFAAGEADFTEALELLKSMEDSPTTPADIAESLSNRGYTRVRLMYLDDAVSDLTESLKIASAVATERGEDLVGLALHNRGNAFFAQGRVAAAIEDLVKAFEMRQRKASDNDIESLESLAAVSRDLGRVFVLSSRSEEARPFLETAVSINQYLFQQNETVATIHAWAESMTGVLAVQRATKRNEETLETAAKIVEIYRDLVNVRGITDRRLDLAAALLNKANILLDLGRLEEARQGATRALAIFQELESASSANSFASEVGRALATIGEIEEANGNKSLAALRLNSAVTLLESTVTLTQTEQERKARRASFSTNACRLIFLACELHSTSNPLPDELKLDCDTWAEVAAYWAERRRARNLTDHLTAAEQKPSGIPDGLYSAYELQKRQLRDVDLRLRDAEAGTDIALDVDSEHRELWIAKLRERRFALLASIRETENSFSRTDPNWTVGAEPLTVEELREAAHGCRAGLLFLDFAPQGLSVVLICPNKSVAARPVGSLSVERAAAWSREWNLASNKYNELYWFDREFEEVRGAWHSTIESVLGDIYAQLWTPTMEWIKQVASAEFEGADRLVLLPGTFLTDFPIHAAGKKPNRILDIFEVVFVPSIGVLSRRLNAEIPPTFDLLAVRNPTAEHAGLRWAEMEVDEALKQVPLHTVFGSEGDARYPPATRERLINELPRHAVSILATHGTYSVLTPWSQSGIHTADPGGVGMLTIQDFYEADLSNVRLLLMTACESGRSELADTSGEQLGLPSAMLAAGARSVVGSLWRIDDLSTALLIRQLFIELKEYRFASMALRRAQLWLSQATRDRLIETFVAMGRESEISSIPTEGDIPYSHPVYWAGFLCWGGY